MDDSDRLRFVHDLYEFNDTAPAPEFIKYREIVSPDIGRPARARECIVDIHGWCMMDNHYHLLISERIEGGLTQFIRKLNVGYAMYFNEKYRRVGTLFQGRTKKKHINSDAYFLHILHYVHLNPLDFHKGSESWRTLEVENSTQALQHLARYRWSSYLDYCGRRNFPSLVNMDLFSDVFKHYEKVIRRYLQDVEITHVRPFLLE